MDETTDKEFSTSFEFCDSTTVSCDPTDRTEMCEKCPEHNRDILYYCTDHDQPGCRSCMSIEHAQCDTALIIANDMYTMETDIEYDILTKKIEQLQQKSISIQTHAEAGSARAEKLQDQVLLDFASFKANVINALEDLESSIKRDIESITLDNKETMRQAIEVSNKEREELKSLATELELIMKAECQQHHDVVSKMQKTHNAIDHIEHTLHKYDGTAILEYTFVENETNDLITQLKTSGMLRRLVPKDIECNLVKEIQITKPSVHRRDSSGIVMLPRNKVALGTTFDHTNSITVIDPGFGSVVTETHLSAKIWDIARLGDDKLAVSQCDTKKIEVFYWNGTKPLEKELEILLPNECYGIAGLHDNIIVTFRQPPSVAILDTKGATLQTYSKDVLGDDLFSFPCNVTVSTDAKSIYVSDYQRNAITCLGLDGNTLATYRDDRLVRPRASYADRNMLVYVCGQGSNNIHVLTSDLNKVTIIQLGPVPKLFGVIPLFDLGAQGPVSIYIDERTEMLYVGMSRHTKLRQYQLSYR